MFLIRTAFWLTLVILLIPTGESDRAGAAAPTAGTDLSATEAILAAQHTVSDLAGFCVRNPQTCETGSAALRMFGQKAQVGAKKLYEYLSDTVGEGDDAATLEASAPAGTDTLRPEDREPTWQGPGTQG
jgi:Family of unknown function (DUF5330)